MMCRVFDSTKLEHLEDILGHAFHDKSLLETAFTHSSAADDRLQSNERLEFLGDAVLGLVICQELFRRFPTCLEGDLTKVKSALVSRGCCAKVTRARGLQKYLVVGKGMASVSQLPRSIEAGLLEGVIGAVYLDGGLDAAASFILRMFADWLDRAEADGPQGNYKSLLQQHSQDRFGVTPSYVLLDEKGPDHNKCFETEVVLKERHFRSAWGVTKKEAEQRAAYNALVDLGIVETSKSED
jgi:ribonuclease-3